MGVAHSSQGLICLENPPKRNLSGRTYSIVAPNSETHNRGAVRRCGLPGCEVGPVLAYHGSFTLYENFRRGLRVNPNGPSLGRREVDSDGNPTPYIFETFREVAERVDNFAAGLEHEGLIPANPDGMKLLALYSRNRPEWLIAEQAAFCHSGITVPLYDNLGAEVVEFIVNQTSLETVVAGCEQQLEKLIEVILSGRCPTLKNVIMIDGVPERLRSDAVRAGLTMYAFSRVEAIGAAHPRPHKPPSGTDVATFCYTSGTTGNPKGALITHRNLIADASAGHLMGLVQTSPGDVHMSYLPLPHIYERAVQVTVIGAGTAIGFSRGDPALLVEDLKALRPSICPLVPRVMNRFHDKIIQGILTAGGLKARLFVRACEAKVQGLHQGQLQHPLWDKLIFNKLKVALGLDNARIMITGSAPVATHVLTFMRILMGKPVVEGYGQTESCAGATATMIGDFSTGHVGGPFSCNEICLKDVPEMGYSHTDTWHGGDPRVNGTGGIACSGRGEVCFRGANVFAGYYKMDEANREVFDEDGWLLSGDIGLWTADGALKIIDRKKNIFKLAQGEYIAPEKIENVLIQSPLVAQSYVHGDSLQSFLVAVIVPDEEAVMVWAMQNGLGDTPFAELCSTAELKAALMDELKIVSQRAGLQNYEVVRVIHVENIPFSIETGILTPTLKLKRIQAHERYADVIKELYGEVSSTALPSRL